MSACLRQPTQAGEGKEPWGGGGASGRTGTGKGIKYRERGAGEQQTPLPPRKELVLKDMLLTQLGKLLLELALSSFGMNCDASFPIFSPFLFSPSLFSPPLSLPGSHLLLPRGTPGPFSGPQPSSLIKIPLYPFTVAFFLLLLTLTTRSGESYKLTFRRVPGLQRMQCTL